jgi:uncharacterized membrane protein YcaP (DUF421 family)
MLDISNPYLMIVARSVIVYFVIIIGIRVFGKKELSQLSIIDLVFILLISNSVQNAMVGSDSSLVGGIIAAASLFTVNFLFKQILFRDKKFSTLLQGNPVMLIHEGKVIEDHLKKEKITLEELQAAVREHGVEKIEDVNLAVLEVDGNISILSENFQKRSKRKRKVHKSLL